jgi:hypothetical protein
MPWQELSPEDLRMRFVTEFLPFALTSVVQRILQ